MPGPVVQSLATWASPGSDATTHSITLPGSLAAGDLLLCIACFDGNVTLTASAGWTKLGQANYSSFFTSGVFYRLALGSGDALTLTTSAAQQGTAHTYRVTGADIVDGAGASGIGHPTPPTLTLSDSGATFVCIAAGLANSLVFTTAGPSGYDGFTFTAPATSLGDPTASAYLEGQTGAAIHPGAFTVNQAGGWLAWTLAAYSLDVTITGQVATTGPLGTTTLVAVAPVRALLSTPGPLAPPAIVARHLAPVTGPLAARGPLRAPSLLATAPARALLATAGPLGTPAVRVESPVAATLTAHGPLGTPRLVAAGAAVAQFALAGPLGRPALRGSVLVPIAGRLALRGPLGRPRLFAQQRFMVAVPPATGPAPRPRLLSDRLPLRRSIVWPQYRADVILPWVYGRVTLAPLPLDDAGLVWLLADHPIVGVTAVRDGATPVSGWQLVQHLDPLGEPIAELRLTSKPKNTLAVDLIGRRHAVTGAVLEHPADLAEHLLTACGWTLPAGAFDALRDRYPGVILGGVLDTDLTLRAAVSLVLGSIDADWGAAPLRAWVDGAPTRLTLTAHDCQTATATATHDGLCNVLRVAYGYDWAVGSPRGSLTLRAPDVLADQGEIQADLDLPWVRTARDALALATVALQQRARPRWEVTLDLPLGTAYAPGQRVTLAHPWVPAGEVVITRVDRRASSQTLTAERRAGAVPRVELISRGARLDAAAEEALTVSYRDGVATFTILSELGQPLAGASVTLDDTDTRTTDQQGRVQFVTARGSHALIVVAAGYAPLEVEVTV
jgi:hypothetical protein